MYLIAGCIGLGTAPWLPFIIPYYWALLAGLVSLTLWRRSSKLALMMLSLCSGLSLSSFQAETVKSSLLDPALEGQSVWLTGRVSGLPTSVIRFGKTVQSFPFTLTSPVCTPEQCQDSIDTVQLRWQREAHIKPGQVWHIRATLIRPRGLSNPAGFNYEKWLITQEIQATGSVSNKYQPTLISNQPKFDTWRWQLITQLEQELPHLENLDLIKAIIFGDKRAIDSEQWELLSHSGTTHLVIVSGLHIGIIIVLTFKLSNLLFAGCRLPTKRLLSAITASTTGFLYSLLAGFTLPTQRAVIMAITVLLLSTLCRAYRPSQLFWLVVLICLMLTPMSVLSGSFWMSFIAVGAILLATSSKTFGNRWQVPQWLNAQIAIIVALTPLLLIIFSSAPLLSVLVNLLAVPYFSFLLVPLTFITTLIQNLGFTPDLLWTLADNALSVFLTGINLVIQHSSQLQLAVTNPFAILILGVAVLLIISPLGLSLKGLAIVMVIAVAFHQPSRPKHNQVLVTVFDVGQGQSILLETQHHSLVYDVGSSWDKGSMAKQVVNPNLLSKHISHIDRLTLSHNDNDHAGGLDDLLAKNTTEQIDRGQPAAYKSNSCHKTPAWQWDGIHFQYLVADAHISPSSNNASCVLMIESNGFKLLIPGDIEAPVEHALVDKYGSDLKANILIAPHHGSKTSSTWLFIRHVDPESVIYTAGYRNRFNHPHPLISHRYQVLGIEQYNTAEKGSISFLIDRGIGGSINSHKQNRRYFWQ